MEQNNNLIDILKGQVLDALIIDVIQNHITSEDYSKAINRITSRISGMNVETKEEPKQKLEPKDIPVRWHSRTDGKRRSRGYKVVLSDGLTSDGFVSRSLADEWLGQYSGYLGKCISTGEKIFNADMKEYILVYEERRK